MAERRILLVRSDVKLAGPGMLMHGIATALRELGWHVEIASSGGALVDRFEADGFVHHSVPGFGVGERKPHSMLAGLSHLRRIVRKSRLDYIHSFNAQAGLLAWFASVGMNCKLVNTVLGAGMEWALRFMPFRLIAVSDFVKQDLLKHGVDSGRIDTVYNGIIAPERVLEGRPEFESLWEKRKNGEEFRFVSIAMMNGDKGHRSLIEAFARFREKSDAENATLVLIGDGKRRRDLEQFAAQRGQAQHVEFFGAQQDVFGFLDQCHVFVHLSPQETFGMVLAEAQARGLPSIAYRVGGIPEVVDNRSGILVSPGDVDAVASAMQRLSNDIDLLRSMGWEGLERTRRLFVRPRLGERLEEVYASL